MKNMSLKIIAEKLEGQLYCSEAFLDKEIEGAVIDSRKVLKDYLFLQLKGRRWTVMILLIKYLKWAH